MIFKNRSVQIKSSARIVIIKITLTAKNSVFLMLQKSNVSLIFSAISLSFKKEKYGIGKEKWILFRAYKKYFFVGADQPVFGISSEMLYPILPVFLTQNLKAGGSIVGLIEGVAGTVQNIIQVFSGRLSDKWQKRKEIAVFGYLLAAISKPLMGLAYGWPLVFGARFMDRFGAGTRSAPRDALIAGSADEKNRGKAFGLEGAGDNLGAFIGPIIAVVLLFIWEINIRSVFYLAIIPGVLSVIMILLVKEKKVSFQSKVKIDTGFKQFPSRYRKYLLVTALFGIGNSSNAFLILQTNIYRISLEEKIFYSFHS